MESLLWRLESASLSEDANLVANDTDDDGVVLMAWKRVIGPALLYTISSFSVMIVSQVFSELSEPLSKREQPLLSLCFQESVETL